MAGVPATSAAAAPPRTDRRGVCACCAGGAKPVAGDTNSIVRKIVNISSSVYLLRARTTRVKFNGGRTEGPTNGDFGSPKNPYKGHRLALALSDQELGQSIG